MNLSPFFEKKKIRITSGKKDHLYQRTKNSPERKGMGQDRPHGKKTGPLWGPLGITQKKRKRKDCPISMSAKFTPKGESGGRWGPPRPAEGGKDGSLSIKRPQMFKKGKEKSGRKIRNKLPRDISPKSKIFKKKGDTRGGKANTKGKANPGSSMLCDARKRG